MFSRISVALLYVFAAFAIFAAALPGGPVTVTVTTTANPQPTIPASQCNVDQKQCCQSVQSASAGGLVGVLLGLLGIVVGDVTALVGLTCVPILGNAGCNAQAVCCQNNSFHGLINIGCTPINIGL